MFSLHQDLQYQDTIDLFELYKAKMSLNSLEANHLNWVWIMKVKRPKNQVDFIEVLNWRPLGVTGPPKNENYT